MKFSKRLVGAFDAHEEFHGGEEVNVLMLSYDRAGSWHATDTGPDSNVVDTDQVIMILSELIAELCSSRIGVRH